MSLLRKKSAASYLLALTLLVAGLGFGIKALLLHPVYIQLANDALHKYTWYTAVLYYLIDGGLIDLAVIAVCYPAAAYAVWQKGLKGSRKIILAFTLLTVAKFVANYVMDILTYSGLPTLKEFLGDIPPILLMLILELVPYAMVLTVAAVATTRYNRKAELASYQAELTETATPAPVLPFAKLVSFRNPIHLASLVGAVAIFLSRQISYHVYQITLYVNFGSTDGWLDMFVTLMADAVLGVLLYFAAILLLPHFHSRAADTD